MFYCFLCRENCGETMIQSIFYERFKGNVNDLLAAGSQPIRVDRTGLFLCLSGEADVQLDDEDYHLVKGSLIVYFPYSLLQVKKRSNDLDGILMSVDLESVQPLLNRMTDLDGLLTIRQHPMVFLSDEQFDQLQKYIRLFLRHQELSRLYAKENKRKLWQLNSLQYEKMKECLMLQIIIAFTDDKSPMTNTVNRKDETVHRFFVLLNRHFRSEHEVNYYSQQLFMSTRYFSFVVKERTGRTPSQWISMALLTAARQLLVETNHSIKEIAEELNFPNQSYFGKWFKSKTGKGPAEYKRSPDEHAIDWVSVDKINSLGANS